MTLYKNYIFKIQNSMIKYERQRKNQSSGSNRKGQKTSGKYKQISKRHTERQGQRAYCRRTQEAQVIQPYFLLRSCVIVSQFESM